MFSATETAALYRRARAFTDLHFYQKWHAVWPRIARLNRDGIRLLDAGCGTGQWSIEIARRRPGWRVTGIDRDAPALEYARAQQDLLELENISFEPADFFVFAPVKPFDIVLSVCSTHYGPTTLHTEQLFARMGDWLGPTGQLVMLVPRRVSETPFATQLTRPRWHDVFSREDLEELCVASHLHAKVITPFIGRLGTIAKQIDWARVDTSRATSGALALLARGIALVDAHVSPSPGPERSLMWLLVAERRK